MGCSWSLRNARSMQGKFRISSNNRFQPNSIENIFLKINQAFIKAVVAKFPVIGWSMWFNEYCFLSREKNKDISVIKKSTEHLKGFLLSYSINYYSLYFKNTRIHAGYCCTPKGLDLMLQNMPRAWNLLKKIIFPNYDIIFYPDRKDSMSWSQI